MPSPAITPQLISLDVTVDGDKSAVINSLVNLFTVAECTDNPALLAEGFAAREAQGSTGFKGRVAIPHCKTEAVDEASIAFVRLNPPVDFGGPDGPADLVFGIAAPASGGKEHLKILSSLARALVKSEFADALRGARTPEEAAELIHKVIAPKPQSVPVTAAAPATPTSAETAPQAAPFQAAPNQLRIVAVTSCPTGIAHTYMAADALTAAAAKRDDITFAVEPQGSSSAEPLDQATIAAADAVIFANEVAVRDEERFAGLPVVKVGVKRAINEPNELLDLAITAARDPQAARVKSGAASADHTTATNGANQQGWGGRIRQAVMTGVSYMVPFVAAGGLLLAIGFALGGYDMAGVFKTVVTDYSLSHLPTHDIPVAGEVVTVRNSGLSLYLGSVFFAIGQAAMGLVVAALSGYIAYALAGRPGIAPGFAGGMISVTLGAGFLGGLVTGIIAGLVAYFISSWKVPRWLGSLMPVVVIPLLTSTVVGLSMFLVLGKPLAAAMTGMQEWLSSMNGASSITVGIILGLMMCSDLGGPINKAAYLFATAGMSSMDPGSLKIMAAVMAAGMVPPLALSLATFVRSRLFTEAEIENGKSAWLLGLSFISEGAIPFAAADPFRVIPSMMLGGAVTGALSMVLGVESSAPHGGVFVAFAIQPIWGFFLSLIAGTVVATVAVIVLKRFAAPRLTEVAAA
ncbi:fructose-specific PTS transporter subunit EIIC [Staphylococcus chromogenes]|nr:fructose-specific PTS transporter subunit EIIC [Staphylococcus chromogenes]